VENRDEAHTPHDGYKQAAKAITHNTNVQGPHINAWLPPTHFLASAGA
jgi:hypothetical protein